MDESGEKLLVGKIMFPYLFLDILTKAAFPIANFSGIYLKYVLTAAKIFHVLSKASLYTLDLKV